jgi:hypothetical protein
MNPTAEPAPDFLDVAPQAVDRALNASLARFTQGIAPSSLIGAYVDWAVHFARRVMCRSATLDGPQCIEMWTCIAPRQCAAGRNS